MPELAATLASPPYDVVDRDGAAELAKDNPRSFLHVVRSEIDLPADVDPHDARVYTKARENLERLVRDGTLRRDAQPALYLYRPFQLAGRLLRILVRSLPSEPAQARRPPAQTWSLSPRRH